MGDPPQDNMSAWATARTFGDLCELMVKYVRGELPGCPGHLAPLDIESEAIVLSLAALNRLGFLTTCSQPGAGPELNGEGGLFGQRAFVSGFCNDELAVRFRVLAVDSEMFVILFAPGERGGCRVPVTLDSGRVFTMAGFDGTDEIEPFAEAAPDAIGVLEQCWYVTVVDPRWGRKRHLWARLAWALAREVDDGEENWPDWRLR